MSARPLFGISCCTRLVGGERAQSVINRYLDPAVHHAGADAVLIPASPGPADLRSLVVRLDGVLLTGSPSNIEPGRYGASDGDGPFDPARDATALALIAAAIDLGKPVFGICRGLQEINIAFGGTLRRDLGAAHHAADGADLATMFGHSHPVSLSAGGVLATAIGRESMPVNSVHYQGIDRLAATLSAEAHADDGVVEAVSARIGKSRVLAIQWHPEWDADSNAASTTFFTLFGRALRGDTPPGFSA